MGRPEKPVRTPNAGLEKLALWLRDRRRQAGLTNRQLAEATVCSAATLARAASGERVPRLPVVEAYARSCGASTAEARRLWRAARCGEQKLTSQPRNEPHTVPPPDLVREPVDLVVALQALYYRSGAMPLGEMERRAGPGRLPHSTLCRMLDGASMLRQDQLTAFLQVCGVPERQQAKWQRAWNRAWRFRQQERQDRTTSSQRAARKATANATNWIRHDGPFAKSHEPPLDSEGRLISTKVLDLQQAAKRLGVSRLTIYNMVRAGKLPVIRSFRGGFWVPESSVRPRPHHRT